MKGFRGFRFIAALASVVLFSTVVLAQGNFVFVNNDVGGPNSVSVFKVGSTGALTPVSGSPFATGGSGQGGGYFATNRVVVSPNGNFLFASNGESNNVAAFSINTSTGVLSAVPGSPFATGGTASEGLSLAIAPNGQFLFAGNDWSQNISVFAISAAGVLSPISGSPFGGAGSVDGMTVSPNGKFLAEADAGSGVHVYSIAVSGALSSVSGSPFATAVSCPTGPSFSNTGTLLFVAHCGSSTAVSVFNVSSTGSLSGISGSPFIFASGVNSNNLVPSPDNRFLFVSNQSSNTITVLAVAPNGTLSLVAGSPFSSGISVYSAALSTDPFGQFLFVTGGDGKVSVFMIAANGVLTAVPGSPFSNPPGQTTPGLTDIPPMPIFSICLADASGNRLLFDPVRGFYEFRNCISAVTAYGQGTAINQGCSTVFYDIKPNRLVKGYVNTCGQPGIGFFSGIPTSIGSVVVNGVTLPITSCGCP